MRTIFNRFLMETFLLTLENVLMKFIVINFVSISSVRDNSYCSVL